jgi:hypothetical protein
MLFSVHHSSHIADTLLVHVTSAHLRERHIHHYAEILHYIKYRLRCTFMQYVLLRIIYHHFFKTFASIIWHTLLTLLAKPHYYYIHYYATLHITPLTLHTHYAFHYSCQTYYQYIINSFSGHSRHYYRHCM